MVVVLCLRIVWVGGLVCSLVCVPQFSAFGWIAQLWLQTRWRDAELANVVRHVD